MVLQRLFRPRPQLLAGRALYAAAVAGARREPFYRRLGVADTREGRFELYGLHVYLLLDRLKDQGEAAKETSQYVLEAMITGLDDAFHELGVGHISVPKRVKKLAAAYLGRIKAYDQAFADSDPAALSQTLARTLYGEQETSASDLALYLGQARVELASWPIDRLLAGEVEWRPL